MLFWNEKRFPNFYQANGISGTRGMTKATTHAFLRIYTHAWTTLLYFHFFYGPEVTPLKANVAGNAEPGIDLSSIAARITKI
jgi:hypothetical protein